MHGVGRTREIEDQLVARSYDLGVHHALLGASQAGAGPPHALGVIEPETPRVHIQLVGQQLSRRSLYLPRDSLIGEGSGVSRWQVMAPDPPPGGVPVAAGGAPWSPRCTWAAGLRRPDYQLLSEPLIAV